jgi:hypothetical protein
MYIYLFIYLFIYVDQDIRIIPDLQLSFPKPLMVL